MWIYKGVVFCRKWSINGKHGKVTNSTKMGADSLTQNIANAPEFISPSPKILDFNEKKASFALNLKSFDSLEHGLQTHDS